MKQDNITKAAGNPQEKAMKMAIMALLFIALAIPAVSLFSQWASSSWASYGTMFVDTNAKNLMEDKI